jgi:hypothetical protein
MAQIKIRVPEYWPDFLVTSYYRPGDSGSHGKYRAIDIAPLWSGSRDRKSAFWFYLYQTANLLWAAQRHGVIYLAAPPNCPHIHIDTLRGVSRMGIEYSAPVNGDCKYVTSWSVDRLKYFENLEFMRKVRDDIGKDYWSSIWHEWNRIKYGFSRGTKYITVHNNNAIGEEDLQSKLDSVFGDGSMSQTIVDNAAQIIGYTNATEAASGFSGFAVLGLLAVAAFFLLKEK